MRSSLTPESWHFTADEHGRLIVGGCPAVELAETYGTPLHVADEDRLQRNAFAFLRTAVDEYPGKIGVHYAFKCNSVPGIIDRLREVGLRAEVMSPFEFQLATRIGFHPHEIVVNGPCKTPLFLQSCVLAQVRAIVVDSIDELRRLACIAQELATPARILLRVNPGIAPRGMNRGTATGSRTACAFGLDLKGHDGGEVGMALDLIRRNSGLQFDGFHLHIGTGIRRTGEFSRALNVLHSLRQIAARRGYPVQTIDVGGGIGSRTSRELTTSELLISQAFGRLPRSLAIGPDPTEIVSEICRAVRRVFDRDPLPELLFEPGRALTSSAQLLLLTVQYVKRRKGAGIWYITDGGLGTVSMPTYYEYHEVFLANDIRRSRTERVTIIGPGCFAGDIVYRGIRMPQANPGEVLAIMDSGAYFTAMESNFGYPRPAIVGVEKNRHRLMRERETFDEMIGRDRIITDSATRRLS